MIVLRDNTKPEEIFIAIAYCVKDLDCHAGRFSVACNPHCHRCCISAVLDMLNRLSDWHQQGALFINKADN